MAHGRESDYIILPSFIASTLSVLNPRNNDLNSFGHAIDFALHPTDWSCRRVYTASNDRFSQHWLDKIKYPVLPNEIFGLEDKLHIRLNLFSFDDAFGYKRYAQYISKHYYPEKNQSSLLGRPICLDKALFTTLFRYYKILAFIVLLVIFLKLNSNYFYSRWEKKHFSTRCLKHFKEQRTLHQHQWYCKNEVEPENLIDDRRNTGGYSKEVSKARYDCVRRLLKKLDAQENNTLI